MLKHSNKQCSTGKAKKALLRLKSSKGSVLFFIVAMMTVLVVIASAAYYAVTSARKQVEVRYEGEQAYQSALALNDIVSDYIGNNMSNAMVQAIADLAVGESVTTTSSDGSEGFSELTGGMGDYKVVIKKLKANDAEGIHTIQIQTIVDVDGEESVVTTVGEFQVKTQQYSFDRFFTSTGYAPNDVIVSGVTITSTLFLDNEYSQFGDNDGSNSGIALNAEIIAAGSVRFNNAPINTDGDDDVDVTIGNNAYFYFPAGVLSLKGRTLRVGGSMAQLNNCYSIDTDTPVYIVGDYYAAAASSSSAPDDAIYVNGDLVVFGNMTFNGTIYVNGNVFVDSSHNQSKIANRLVVGGNVYTHNFPDYKKTAYFGSDKATIKGSFIDCETAINLTLTESTTAEELRAEIDKIQAENGAGANSYVWPSDALLCESLEEVVANINEKIGNPQYINWDLEDKFFEDGALIPQTDINFDMVNWKIDFVKTLSARDATTYVIGDITFPVNYGRFGLIFDTETDGGYEDIYVYLKPNCYWDSATKTMKADDPTQFDHFMWNPPGNGNDNPFHVLVKGKGSLIMVLPDGVKYVANSQSFVGHVGLFQKIVDDGDFVNDPAILDGRSDKGFKAVSAVKDAIAPKIVGDGGANPGLLDENSRFNSAILAETGDSGTQTYIHNNVFLVTVDMNAEMDFQAQQNFFAGFIYAPYMTFKSSSSGSQAGMLGGMIVSDYCMDKTSNIYICSVPYDYYDRFVTATTEEEKEKERVRYMEKLMLDSGSSEVMGSSTTRTWRKYGYN